MDRDRLIAEARAGSIRAGTRLISLLEDDPTLLPSLFQGMGAWPSPRLVVGFTGAPGVGKSSLVDRLIGSWRRADPEGRVGVVAVDPSSPFTGGALLGDRVRMMGHSMDPGVFIRSLATRGHLGGLTLGIKSTLRVLGLLGHRVVLVETVGVGQSEIQVAETADLCAVLLAPGQGDGVQLLKAGLLEAADLFVINKADRPGAELVASELAATLSLRRGEGPPPPVFLVSAAEGTGVEELRAGIERRAAELSARIQERRRRSSADEVRQALLEAGRARLDAALGSGQDLEKTVNRILEGEASIPAVTEELMRAALSRPREERP